MPRQLKWPPILDRAAEIVRSYDTPVTLRQLFYRLVAAQLVPNTRITYQTLSDRTAIARRAGTFPALADRGTELFGGPGLDLAPQAFLQSSIDGYWLDPTDGQRYLIVVACEKATMLSQLGAWLPRGVLHLALGGFASQTTADDLRRAVEGDGRPAVLLYLGDHDASGWDIERDLIDRTGDIWKIAVRVGLTPDQVEQYDLPEAPGKPKDSRSRGFIDRFGANVQVELEALDPNDLRALVTSEVGGLWSEAAYAAVLARQAADRSAMRAFVETWDAG